MQHTLVTAYRMHACTTAKLASSAARMASYIANIQHITPHNARTSLGRIYAPFTGDLRLLHSRRLNGFVLAVYTA